MLLLTPGFLTDALGFALLLPACAIIGRALWKLLERSRNVHFSVHGAQHPGNAGPNDRPGRGGGPVIDGEEFGVARDDPPANENSPRMSDKS